MRMGKKWEEKRLCKKERKEGRQAIKIYKVTENGRIGIRELF